MANEMYALDIETDGLVEPIPTTFTLFNGENALCVVRESTVEADSDAVLKQVMDNFHDTDVEIDMTIVTDDWDSMAQKVADLLNSFHESDKLVTYNGLAYRGGFDIPVLDYAFHQTDVQNPLTGLEHTDVYDVVNRGYVYNTVPQFPSRGGPSKSDMQAAAEMFELAEEATGLNKSPLADLLNAELSASQMNEWAQSTGNDVPTTENGSLDAVYAYLYDEEYPDPFDDSEEAVEAWETGQYADVLTHNITDTVKTKKVYDFVDESAIPFKHYSPTRLG